MPLNTALAEKRTATGDPVEIDSHWDTYARGKAGAHGNATPLVVVGNGPVGMRFIDELRQRGDTRPIVVYGEERHLPYDRVQLSSWLAGAVTLDSLMRPRSARRDLMLSERFGVRVESVNLRDHTLVDSTGLTQTYDQLVLATGSSPFIPNVPGMSLPGVFTLRNLDDASALMARQARSHQTVVIGGGLLGLEAARGMMCGGTTVTVVEHADRLMATQLDVDGAVCLQSHLATHGLQFRVGDGVRRVGGNERVEWIELQSGQRIACDTVVVATGIRPNIELARQSGLAFGRGIRVDNAMTTSDPQVYAIGECAEHDGEVYGLVAPGFEQAAVAAAGITSDTGRYGGSVAASRLKVVGTPVFSMGPFGMAAAPFFGATYVYRDHAKGIYRKLLVRGTRLHGALGIGEWPEVARLQAHVADSGRVYPWQVIRFVHTGLLWPADETGQVRHWPAEAVVCQCNSVTRGAISDAIDSGVISIRDISAQTRAGTVCGSCKPLLGELLDRNEAPEPVSMFRSVSVLSVAGLLTAMAFVLFNGVGYAGSVQDIGWLGLWGENRWDVLWRDGFVKQVTGYSILALFLLGLVLSPRKRIQRLHQAGSFDGWRMFHVVLGLACTVMLVAHTGFRLGNGVDFVLMSVFVALLAIGSVSSLVIGLGHRFDAAIATRLRRQSVFAHLLLFWPVPALLAWHVFKSYWY